MLRDAKTKVTGIRKVLLPQLVFLDLQTSLEDFLSLGTSHGDVDGDLFVAADPEGADGVAGFACKKRGQLLAHAQRGDVWGGNWGIGGLTDCRQAFDH